MIRYTPLHTFSNYSFLEGASFPEELVVQAAAFDLPAIAITDRDGMYGIVRAHLTAREAGIKLLVGSTITRTDGPPLVLLAKNKQGYAAICKLISEGRSTAEKGQSSVETRQITAHCHSHVIAIHPALHEEQHDGQLVAAFKDRLYAGLARYMLPDDEQRITAIMEGAARLRLPLVAAPSIFFHTRRRKDVCDILAAIRLRKPVDELAGSQMVPNGNFTLLHPAAFQRVYHDHPDAVARTMEIVDRCNFSIDELKYHYPREVVPKGQTPISHLRNLTWRMAAERYEGAIPAKVKDQLSHELALIEELKYPNYFLTMYDIVAFARSSGILCQGRGSAANSAVCYVLGITAVDPARSELLFERFISRERDEPPDIDVDFEHERREEVIQYIYQRYGRHRAAMVAEFIRYRTRSAIRDVGKALGLSMPQVTRLSNLASSFKRDQENWWDKAVETAGFSPSHPKIKVFHSLVRRLRGFPRHLSIHVGGFIISDIPVSHLVPIEPGRMEKRTVIQWDKEDVEDAGLLKIDVLGLGMLTCLRKSFELLALHKRIHLDLYAIPPGDRATYRMIQAADTVGVFQIESRAQMSMLPRLKPTTFYDLVVEVAIVRPGPIQGGMVHPYLRRRQGKEKITYPLPELEKVLSRTFGVPLFQEQVMSLAMVAGGFSGGEADQLRRAMGTWRSNGRLEGLLDKLMSRMEKRGLSHEYATQIANQIKGFGEYGFPESHAASFALLAYASAYVKCHHPEVFAAALLNSQPMGFYSPASIVEDCRRHGVEVRGVCVNRSRYETTLEGAALRLGFSLVRGMREELAQKLVDKRASQGGPFASLEQFIKLTELPTHALLKLALAGAVAGFGLERRQALWAVLSTWNEPESLFHGRELRDRESSESLVPMSAWEKVLADLEASSVYLSAHPFELVHPHLRKYSRYVSSGQLEKLCNGRRVTVGGLAVIKQRPPTANGVMFVTLEDHEGFFNLVVQAAVMQKFRRVFLEEAILLVDGRLEKADGVMNIMVERAQGVRMQVDRGKIKMRNFR